LGKRYSDDWHVAHMINPRELVPESIMPGYPFLATTPLDTSDIADHLKANQMVGVPYSEDMIANAAVDLAAQVDPDSDDLEAFEERYAKAQVRNFDGNAEMISELDALIAYMQMLGTLVDFTTYKAEGQNLR
jgi:cytochrome c oxidase cbb3-type subunit 2